MVDFLFPACSTEKEFNQSPLNESVIRGRGRVLGEFRGRQHKDIGRDFLFPNSPDCSVLRKP